MASSYMLRPLCTAHQFYSTPSSEDRVCCCNSLRGRRRATRPAFVLPCSRDRGDFSLLSVKFSSSSARITGFNLSQGDFTGQANAVAETNVDAQLNNPLVEAQPLSGASSTDSSNGSAAPGPAADPGPEFDYQVYAANTMIGYEPPPPPRIPFGGPFEDYYDEYVGVDYVPKQEKPTSSFLMFLESLNEKRAEEEAKLREKDPTRPPFNPKPNKHLFEGKPLFTIPRPIQPAHIPRGYTPPSVDPNEDTTPKRMFSPMPPKEEIQRRKQRAAEKNAALKSAAGTTSKEEGVDSESVSEVPIDSEDVLSKVIEVGTDQSVVPSPENAVEEFSPSGTLDEGINSTPPVTLAKEPSFGERTLSPQLRSTGSSAEAMSSPSTRPFETTSSKSLYPSSRPFEAPADASGSLFPQSRPVTAESSTNLDASQRLQETSYGGSTSSPQVRSTGHNADATSFSPSTRPFETTSSQPLYPTTRPFEAPADSSGSLFPQTRTATDQSRTGLDASQRPEEPSFGGRTLTPQLRTTGDSAEGMSLSPSTRPFETTSSQSLYPSTGPSEAPADASGSLFPQTTPAGQQSSPTLDASQISPQTDGTFQDDPTVVIPSTEFYEPNDGDIVLGVVTHADEDELSLEIGGRVPALMTMRDFQPFTEIGPNSFFKIPLDDGSNESLEGFVAPPQGKSFLVEDKEANDGIYHGENVSVGTVVVAEVHSKALVEGRPVLICRRLARSLGFVRIEQIMRTGEPIDIEINQSNDGGLQGYLEGVRAFLPRSELLRRPENSAALQDYVGKTLKVALLQAEEYSSNVIISEAKAWMSENLLLGTVHDLVVTRIYPYGMQVEIIGTRIRGFIHISSISRGYVTSLHTFFVEGEELKAMVIKGKKPGQLSFSIEAIEPPSEEGLVLRDKETVYYGAEEVAKSTYEYQLPIEERRIFALPTAATSVTLRNGIANLPWLKLENLRNSS